ncbi:hypothetical protein Salat_0048700 [Sesamum alatum]|uniref:Uncharacterized protein n=1 Tax=Sesamum alatum TaxID=300844 RepID=A0AAE2CWL3_9LAMI|nr:hypothetical protein Salat_0048700 [Sesamum alatum]
MDAEEKLTALKKAYADIILNISKEAAARVMSSDRRAVRYQHELKVAKEESVRMLLRLKQMMDSKISEVEAASLNQQKKIEELEAQLQEAEDIVRDLREELEEVQTELERVKKNNLQPVNEPKNACSIEMENIICSYEPSKFLDPETHDEFSVAPDLTTVTLSQRNECLKCGSKSVCMCSSSIGNKDLPSIILRGKEPGLYRNGCTQRIRACERNLLDKELCLSGDSDKVKNEDGEQEGGEDTYEAPASGAKALSELDKKMLADVKPSRFKSFLRKRKRATRRRKAITPLSWKRTDVQKPYDVPELSAKHFPVSVGDSGHPGEDPSKLASVLSPCNAETRTHLGRAESSEKESNLLEISGGRIMQKNQGLEEQMVPSGEESGLAENLWSSDCHMDDEKVDILPNSLDSNSSDITEVLPHQPVSKRVIKYTFQRKRKRETPSESEVNASLETEQETGNMQNTDKNLDRSKPSSVMESSRDSRRLAQVARQLISLSERKWWD